MNVLSAFSGIAAETVAWETLGFRTVAFSEVDPFCARLLEERFPNTVNEGDIRYVDWNRYRGSIDIAIGGSPCQAYSVAGKRKGMLDARGRLMHEYVRAVKEAGPRWVVWENVPGVLSQSGGRAFATLQGELEDLGYAMAWAVLDAQWFGVAQRRKRVFLVGHPRIECASAVLFEQESLLGRPPSCEGEGPSPGIEVDAGIPDGLDGPSEPLAFSSGQSAGAGSMGLGIDVSPTLRASMSGTNQVPTIAFDWSASGTRGFADSEDLSPTLRSHGNVPAIAEDLRSYPCGEYSPNYQNPVLCMADMQKNAAIDDDLAGTLTVFGDPPIVMQPGYLDEVVGGINYWLKWQWAMRRLMPVECERLMGFPDGWTDIPGASDSARYSALGNSIAVPVLEWIGRGIEYVDRLEGAS